MYFVQNIAGGKVFVTTSQGKYLIKDDWIGVEPQNIGKVEGGITF